MELAMDRRAFLAAASGLYAERALGARLPVRAAVLSTMLPRTLSWREQFELAREAGFEQVECMTARSEAAADEIAKASQSARLPVHSVLNEWNWKYPLTSPDPEIAAQGMRGMEASLRQARLWGAETVLLVPAVVDPKTRYHEAWTRSQQQVRRLLQLAEECRAVIAIENVIGARFLPSPLEYVRYIDEFQSPRVRAYFDVGNSLRFGFPQDWIRTIGGRLVKVHLKDARSKPQDGPQPALLEGDVDWAAVREALSDVGFKGSATVELPAGDAAYLSEVRRRVERILSA
jgi:hexulose-6-phosphate isomerase